VNDFKIYPLDFLFNVCGRLYIGAYFTSFLKGYYGFTILQTLNNYKMRLGCRNNVASLPPLPLSSIKRIKKPHLTNLSSVPTLLTLNLPVFRVLSCLSCCSKNILFKYFLKILFQKCP